MKFTRFLPLVFVLFFFSCEKDEDLLITPVQETKSLGKALQDAPEGDFEVFFAQTHVLRPRDPYFGLVSDRPALIKAHLFSETGEVAPAVIATLSLDGKTETLELAGPLILPPPADLSPGKVVHSFDDSYTRLIPKEWVQPGLEITIEAGDKMVRLENLLIGAPNRIPVTMLDAHFFTRGTGDYPKDWEKNMAAKLPMAEFDLRRISEVVFSEVSIAPRPGKVRAVRVSSEQDYEDQTGWEFDNEQATASMWNRALHAAGGQILERGLFHTNLHNVPTDGQGSRFSSTSNIHKEVLFFHEFGHAMDLHHWGNANWNDVFPYRGEMHGLPAPDVHGSVHAGPTWKYDLDKKEFISPIVFNGTHDRYKKDPMQGSDQDIAPGHFFPHYSDYSVDRIRKFLETWAAVWNEEEGAYARWSHETGSYSRIVTHNNGVAFPQEAETDVISVMASVSHASPDANLIYPPMGPYKGGIIKLFDAENAADREEADRLYCGDGSCDVSLRIKQANKETTTYIFPMKVDTTLGPKEVGSLITRAINLRYTDGLVTKVEMLYTPNVEEQGLPENPVVLDVWEKE